MTQSSTPCDTAPLSAQHPLIASTAADHCDEIIDYEAF